MPSVTALRRWLVFVALLRLFSGGLGGRLRCNCCRWACGSAGPPVIERAGFQSPLLRRRYCPPQWGWAMRRHTDSRPTCTPSSRKEVGGGALLLMPMGPQIRRLPCNWRVPPPTTPFLPLPWPLAPLAACAVTDLAGRIFSTWTLTSSMLCLICARNPCVPAIYGEATGGQRGQRSAGRLACLACSRRNPAAALLCCVVLCCVVLCCVVLCCVVCSS